MPLNLQLPSRYKSDPGAGRRTPVHESKGKGHSVASETEHANQGTVALRPITTFSPIRQNHPTTSLYSLKSPVIPHPGSCSVRTTCAERASRRHLRSKAQRLLCSRARALLLTLNLVIATRLHQSAAQCGPDGSKLRESRSAGFMRRIRGRILLPPPRIFCTSGAPSGLDAP